MKRHVLVGTAFMAAAISCGAAQTQHRETETRINCDQQEVKYSAFDPSFQRSIVVSEVSEPADLSTSKERTFTVQHTRWLLERKADFSKPGPWTSTILVGGVGYKGRVLKISFLDHDSGGVWARWLNEKLLFAQVWWGRFRSVDVVLDVQNKQFIYQEMADYLDLGQPCAK